jgi:D-glycero-alpha-D-manno-heptose-7-phosphate kinase
MGIDGGIEIAVVSDLPARTGLGSSSCFTVGLLHALHAFKGEMVSREQLAAEAVHVERECIVERVGLQDQYACACGGLAKYEFKDDKTVTITPIAMPSERKSALGKRLMLFYTGQQRSAHDVLEKQLSRTATGAISPDLCKLREMVDQGVKTLTDCADLDRFGELLHEGWLLKKRFSEAISTNLVDDAYERARKAGAIGGKLLGAGGGGFLLIYSEPEKQSRVREALSFMREVSLDFDHQGSRVIYYTT